MNCLSAICAYSYIRPRRAPSSATPVREHSTLTAPRDGCWRPAGVLLDGGLGFAARRWGLRGLALRGALCRWPLVDGWSARLLRIPRCGTRLLRIPRCGTRGFRVRRCEARGFRGHGGRRLRFTERDFAGDGGGGGHQGRESVGEGAFGAPGGRSTELLQEGAVCERCVEAELKCRQRLARSVVVLGTNLTELHLWHAGRVQGLGRAPGIGLR